MGVGVHQGSVLNLLLFIVVLEALSCEFALGPPGRTSVPVALLSSLGPLGGCVGRLLAWREAVGKKGLNTGGTGVVVCGAGLGLLRGSGSFPCAVCCAGCAGGAVGSDAWGGTLAAGVRSAGCAQCQGLRAPWVVRVRPGRLGVVASFCCLGDVLSSADVCGLLTTARMGAAWRGFGGLLPVLSLHCLSFGACGCVCGSCVWGPVLRAGGAWPLTELSLQRLQRNDRAMIRQICNVRPQDIVTTGSNELLVRLGIADLDLILKERRLRWYGHVEHSNGAVKTAFDIQVDGKHGPGRPKMKFFKSKTYFNE